MSTQPPPDPRGAIFPQRLPTLTRYSPREGSRDLVQWFWIPRWRVPPGQIRRQDVLSFPSANLTIEPSGTTLTGPTTTATHIDLSGTGWALGVLLQPAGLAAMAVPPSAIRDTAISHPIPEVHQAVVEDMAAGADLAAIASLSAWLERLPAPPYRALEANRLLQTVARCPEITTTGALAEAMHASPRTLQRLAEDFIGLRPLQVIRRYRLQEAAKQLREGTSTIAGIAARLGYADHAHLTHDFRQLLAYSPREYREAAE